MKNHRIKFLDLKTIMITDGEQNPELVKLAKCFLQDKNYQNHKEIFKYKIADQRCRFVYKTELDSETYFVKKYVNRSIVKVFLDLLRTQRSVVSMLTFWHLRSKGIPTYEQLFALIDRRKVFNRPSLVISKECKGRTIKQLLQTEISGDDKAGLLEQWIELYVKLLKGHVYHHDPNLSNFILEDGVLKLIDLDDIRVYPCISDRLLKKNLKKFNKILFLAYTREKNGNIDFNNEDREYIIQEVIKRYDNKLPLKKYLNYLERKTKIPVFEIKRLVKVN